jgi:hypothetical protein
MIMTESGRRWQVKDRQGNEIYLTQERWGHIIYATNHPEIEDFEDYLKQALKRGQRKQEPLNPRKYRYVEFFDDLPEQMNTIVVIVMFDFDVDPSGQTSPNNYVTTAFFKHIKSKR